MDDETAKALVLISGCMSRSAISILQLHDTRLHEVARAQVEAAEAITALPAVAALLEAKKAAAEKPPWEIVVTHDVRGVQIGSFDAGCSFDVGDDFKLEGQLYLILEVTNTDPHRLRQRVRVKPVPTTEGGDTDGDEDGTKRNKNPEV